MICEMTEDKIVQDCMASSGDWKLVNYFNGGTLLEGVNLPAASASEYWATHAVVPMEWSWEFNHRANQWQWLSPDWKEGVAYPGGFFKAS
jgi:hypothetical protein